MAKRLLFPLIAILLVLSLASCKREVKMEHCELGILLPEDFALHNAEGTFDLAYSDGELVVGLVRLSYDAAILDGIPATLTREEFARFYLAESGKETKGIFEYGDCHYFTYTEVNGGISYRYTHTFYTTPYAYFVISFISYESGQWGLEQTLSLTKSVYLKNI